MPKNNLDFKKKSFNHILIQKIGKSKFSKLNLDEDILKSGVIDSMDFAEIFVSIEKKFKIKIPFEKIFGKKSHISVNNLRKCKKWTFQN